MRPAQILLVGFLAVLLVTLSAPARSGAPPTDEALFIAIDQGSSARVLTLLDSGANPNARDDRGEPALIYALHTGKPAIAEILAHAKGIDLEAENHYGQTALMVAAYQGRLDLVNELIDDDAEVNHKGWTALHFAASSGQVDVVRVLLDHAAYIDAESPSRTTPLMMAARVKDRPTCVLLLQEGADPTPINAVGLSAADFARRAGDTELGDWLDENAKNWRTAHPVHGAEPAAAASPPASPPTATPSPPPPTSALPPS